MDNYTRQAHLSEMGVSQWHARLVLVGAAESPKISVLPLKALESPIKFQELPVVSQIGNMESPQAAISGGAVESLVGGVPKSPIKSPSSGVKSLAEMPILTTDSDGVTETVSAPQIRGGKIPDVSFGAFVSDGYIVVSDMGSDVSHLEEVSLLQNIIKVVDSSCSRFEFSGGFNWPVFNSTKVLVGQELLHEALIARWLASINLAQSQVLMCFGGQSKRIIENLLNDSPQRLGECKVVYFGDSLTDLYKNPLRKKNIWKILCENLDKFSRSGEA